MIDNILGVNAQSSAVCLHKLPENVFGRLVDVVATSILCKVTFERHLHDDVGEEFMRRL